MARRKQFKGIAGNLAKWMVSRNFDTKGYWAVGVLCKQAELNKVTEISLKLIGNHDAIEFAVPLEGLRQELYKYMKSCRMPDSWLAEAEVKFEFNVQPIPMYHLWGSALGTPFVCTVTLTTDLGRKFINQNGCFCRPHNPEKEQRRYGF
jgi:hypothetical protein